MPHHEEGYVSKHIAELMRWNDPASKRPSSVLEVAQLLHEITTGATELYSKEPEETAVEVINFYLDHWVTSKSTYDAAVHSLLTIALREYEEKIQPGTQSPLN